MTKLGSFFAICVALATVASTPVLVAMRGYMNFKGQKQENCQTPPPNTNVKGRDKQ
jgi:hypothetical protein